MSMTARLMLSYLAITLAILLVLGIPLGIFFRTMEVDRLTSAMERDASTLASLVEDDLENGDPPAGAEAESYARDTGARVVVTDSDGISLIDTAAPSERDLSTRPEIQEALSGGSTSGSRRSDTLDDDLLYVTAPVASSGRVYGAVRITLGTHELNERVDRFWLSVTAVGALVLLLAASVGWTMARWVSLPVRRLASTAERFAAGDLSPEPEQASVPGEIAALQRVMNDMAQRLDAQLAQQRNFVADASHQLRTPLTALRLRLENLEESVAALDAGSDLSGAITEVDRLSALVTSLLRLARAEQSPGSAEVCDLVALSRDRADTWEAVAQAEGVELSFDSADDAIEILAVPGAIEQVLDNLIDNAVMAAPEADGLVSLEVGHDEGGAWLAVSDNGPGLDAQARVRALDRFWRGDKRRPGSGLGLPIVVELLRAMGGGIELLDSRHGGLRAEVRFGVQDREITTGSSE